MTESIRRALREAGESCFAKSPPHGGDIAVVWDVLWTESCVGMTACLLYNEPTSCTWPARLSP